eukprot:Skav214409  [mRNA]  locus=scaffold5157:39264:42174:+ [translate_table: standard]
MPIVVDVSFAQHQDEPQDTLDETTDFPALAGSTDEPAGFTCPGGKILPPHNTRPRRPTTSELDALCSARRPLGTLAPEPPAPAPALFRDTDEAEDVWTRHPATGRLERLEKMDPGHPGPGDYDLPALPGPPIFQLQLMVQAVRCCKCSWEEWKVP